MVATNEQYAIVETFRDQYIAGAERGVSVLKNYVTSDIVKQGSLYTFLVADSGSASATTRGLNGEIPARTTNNTQLQVQLEEWNDLVKETGFNMFQSQGPRLDIMRMTSLKTLGRKIDDKIMTALDTSTVGVSTTASTNVLGLLEDALNILGLNNFATDSGQVAAVISPTFMSRLRKTKEFAHFDWSNAKPLTEGIPNPQRVYSYLGIDLIVHNGLNGRAGASEKNFLFHKDAIGFAMDKSDITVEVDFNKEQNYSFCRATGYFGAKLLQTNGVIEMLHDATGVAAASV